MTRSRLGSLMLLALTVSCSETELTQLMVVVDTDFEVPSELDEVAITVDAPDGQRAASEGAIIASDLPLRLAVVHRSGPLGPIRIKVEGLLGGQVEIQRRAEVDFVAGELRVLRMDLLRSCLGVSCAVDETCGAEGCRPRRVEEAELAPWEGPTRLDFGVADMGPQDLSVDGCVPTEELCNAVDDDCDGDVDETFDLQSDMRHCGECDNMCAVDPDRGSMSCVAGGCSLTCDEGFADCDGDEANGCEASLSAAATCGSCGTRCEGATSVCDGDTCVADCPGGTDRCGDTCADLQSSVVHCGSCGIECSDADNASPLCAEGECRLRCDPSFFNCDGELANGCESRQRELAHCGACGAACEAAKAVTSCATGECELVTCEVGYGDCDGDLMNGCEADLAGDPETCGACGNACPPDPPHASALCVMGACGVACDPGFADCNMDPLDGCESFLGDPTSCGACGISCDGATPACSGSSATGFACSAECAAGETICGASCVDLQSDVRHCGACAATCSDPARARPTCTGGECGIRCDPGFADCDMNADNGCETSITSTTDCGSCGNVCAPAPDATIGCVADTCTIASCVGTTRDCDGDYVNGCETETMDDVTSCGACGVSCTPGPRVASVRCAGGACMIESCEPGFADCDGDFATGCEQQLGTKFHCAGCGDRCRGGGTNRCCGGACGSC